MERTAKLFKKGQNQAVMLPAEFAFDTESVYIRRDEEGNVVLTARSEKEQFSRQCAGMAEESR